MDEFKECDESKLQEWDGKCHLIEIPADHGIFVWGSLCDKVFSTCHPEGASTWDFSEVNCLECLAIIEKENGFCKLCKVNRSSWDFCNPCCSKHHEEQRAKYPGLNPLYWDPMPGEPDDASDEFKEERRKKRAELGFE